MKKSIIIASVIVGLVIILALVTGTKTKTNNKKELIKYLEKNGYVLDEETDIDPDTKETSTSKIYHKQTSEKDLNTYLSDIESNTNSKYEEFFFNIDNYSFIKVLMKYEDGVTTMFKAEKYLDKDIVSYNYEISILSSSMMLNGTYTEKDNTFDSKNITCDVAYTVRLDDEEKDTYCNISKYELLTFLEDINSFLDSPKIKNIINKGPTKK